MGRQPKNDNADSETIKRRLRQRANQQRAVERKRQAVDEYQAQLDSLTKAVGNKFAKYNMLSKKIEELIIELRSKNLSYQDQQEMENLQRRVAMLNESTKSFQDPEERVAEGAEQTTPEPPTRRRRKTRDQAVPI